MTIVRQCLLVLWKLRGCEYWLSQASFSHDRDYDPHAEPVQIVLDLIFENKDKFGYLMLRDCCASDFVDTSSIYMNGNWLGQVTDPIALRDFLWEQRKKHVIEHSVGIVYSFPNNELFIQTSGGRFIRHILKVENNELVLKKEMMNKIGKSITRSEP